MSTRVDAILAAIDTGLQTAGDTAYGNDWPGTCWRCGEAAEDLCAGCRERLRDETTVQAPPRTVAEIRAALDAILASVDRLAPWQRRIVAECAEIDHINARSITQ